MKGYKTVLKPAQGEITEKRSRFIAYVSPAKTEEEALNFAEKIKKMNYSARHNVFAYRLLGGAERYSEDGEPQGTAGAPVLDLLRGEELTDCVVVVTRYFGGILLGTGGLVRAYTAAAKKALEAAGEKICRPFTVYGVRCGYAFYGKAESLVSELGGKIVSEAFSDSVQFDAQIPQENAAVFEKKLCDLSGGTVKAQKIGEICI